MKFELDRLNIALPGGRPLTIRQVEGSAVHVLGGRVWLTQSGSPDDVFLEAGETFRFDNDADVMLTAEGPAARLLLDAPLTVRSRSTLVSALKQMFGRRFAGAS